MKCGCKCNNTLRIPYGNPFRLCMCRSNVAPGNPDNITFSDIDSTLNGSYQDTTVSLPTTGIHLSGGDGNWNFGHGLVQFDITLTPKS